MLASWSVSGVGQLVEMIGRWSWPIGEVSQLMELIGIDTAIVSKSKKVIRIQGSNSENFLQKRRVKLIKRREAWKKLRK